jgi:selenocysteine lyase/cysteine desulfurase
MEDVYLNSGSQHPLPLRSLEAARRYLEGRTMRTPDSRFRQNADETLARYARLVNADVDEVTFVQSTTTAEQMFIRALGLPRADAHVVTDTLHFFGSLPMYMELEKQGTKVTWVQAREGRIPLEDMLAAIVPGTSLVSLSLVSTVNGFEHDLAAICERAHTVGALVYADIIHAAGAMPVDLHATGVDLAAGASYKWLMGEFGLGFLYVRRDVQPRLERTNYGYYGMTGLENHVLDPGHDRVVDYAFRTDATGGFALGTRDHTSMVILNESLGYILDTGVARIHEYVQTLTSPLQSALTERGFQVVTPPESKAPIVTCIYEKARERLGPRLKSAGIQITVGGNSFRITPSVFNDQADVNRLLDALDRA